MKTLAITIGDINGIGPEVSLKAAFRHRWPADLRLVLVGHGGILREQARRFGLRVPPAWDPSSRARPAARVTVWDPFPRAHITWRPGLITRKAAELSVDWIHSAVRKCLDGTFAGMITAPICKEGLKKAGLDIPGHTEFIARLTQTKRYAMMLIGGPLRVVLVTRHIPLRHVADSLKKENILECIQIAAEALPWLGVRRGRIGVAGLNPHAGDGGAIGTEEIELIAPAVRAARRGGLRAEGPVPPDVIFHKAARGAYDAVVCMYHDQGLGPLKMLAFESGINITLGLPILRTSPDHGTAFDIAGQGRADPGSMIAAIKLASGLSKRKNPWR
ncbi:MAG: 4-hydroxythreonine-4-phosphate dehydrogenase PdxA [Kiritimatiellae bacterium]|nr:4-hydroxythreonine-4-phosphate dehydrogenase PdxA [Kiritimatiellia bacterium]